MSHYDTLGLPRDADQAAIKKAFRTRASKAHPDREGGDAAAMASLNRAVEVLSDPDRRRRYDETGTDKEALTPEQEARGLLMQVFNLVMNEDGEWVSQARIVLQKGRAELQSRKAEAVAAKGRFVKRRGKIKTRAGVENIVHMLADQKIAAATQAIETIELALIVNDLARALLDAYEADPEEAASFTINTGWRL